jgi:hypothetical protein
MCRPRTGIKTASGLLKVCLREIGWIDGYDGRVGAGDKVNAESSASVYVAASAV